MSRALSHILEQGLSTSFHTWTANKAEFRKNKEVRQAVTEGKKQLDQVEGEKRAKEAQLTVFSNTQEVILGHMDLMTQAPHRSVSPRCKVLRLMGVCVL